MLDRCYDRHTHAEFLDFLEHVAMTHPRVPRHVVCEDYATHQHPNVKTWLAKNPRITMHFHSDQQQLAQHGRDLLRDHHPQAIRRGTCTSVKELTGAIETFIDGWNERCEPFTWTKTADEITGRINRKRTNATRH